MKPNDLNYHGFVQWCYVIQNDAKYRFFLKITSTPFRVLWTTYILMLFFTESELYLLRLHSPKEDVIRKVKETWRKHVKLRVMCNYCLYTSYSTETIRQTDKHLKYNFRPIFLLPRCELSRSLFVNRCTSYIQFIYADYIQSVTIQFEKITHNFTLFDN